ncbi:MAG: hypothetical protein H7066_06240 [Cytophagaceae bacterium]|nr:hypothetical protein [Gemmatimonadaceae bacterium]
MPTVTRVKLVLAVLGLLLFAAGARWENTILRWVAIGVIAAAFLLRFWRAKEDDPPPPPPEA